jgi:hypothetical protein
MYSIISAEDLAYIFIVKEVDDLLELVLTRAVFCGDVFDEFEDVRCFFYRL